MDAGKSLRVAMAMRGVKNKKLAEDMGVSNQQVTNWLSGPVGLGNIKSLSEYFGMKVSAFIALGED